MTTFALVAALSSITVAVASFLLVSEASVRRAVDTRIRETTLLMEEAAEWLPESATLAELRDGLAVEQSPFGFEVAVESATEFETDSSTLTAATVPSHLRGSATDGDVSASRVRVDDELAVVVGSPLRAHEAVAYFLFPLGALVEDLALLRTVLVWTGVVVVAVSAGVGWAAASGLLKPIRRAHRAARQLEAGSLGTRLPEAGRDEFAELARAFNEMAGTLQQTVADLQEMERSHRQFVSDVSHELRTPLSTLSAASEVLEANAAGLDDTGSRAARLLVVEVRRLASLVEELMEISRMDAGTASMVWEPLDVAAHVQAALEARSWSEVVTLHSSGDLRVLADPRRLDTIVANLIGNALEHGKPPVRVVIDGDDRAEVRLSVVDAGNGIDPEQRRRVFDRFYKVDTARGHGGSGLGLAIAIENARLHGGDVTLQTQEEKGTTFRVVIPREGRATVGALRP